MQIKKVAAQKMKTIIMDIRDHVMTVTVKNIKKVRTKRKEKMKARIMATTEKEAEEQINVTSVVEVVNPNVEETELMKTKNWL